MGCLYQLTFPNGKSYIGITTKTFSKRFKAHTGNVKIGRRASLYAAWRKYGEPASKVLAIVENYELLQTEIRAIKLFNTLTPNGYNMTEGGDESPMLRQDVVDKMMATKTKNNSFNSITEKGRKALSSAHKGNQHTKGKKHTAEWKLAASERMKGNKHAVGQVISEERRKAASERSKGNKIMLGRKLSKETKERMKVSQQARRELEAYDNSKENQS